MGRLVRPLARRTKADPGRPGSTRDGVGLTDHARRDLDGTRVRARRRGKRGSRADAPGRSRGGYGTKVRLRSDASSMPLGFVLTLGKAHVAVA